MSDFSQNCVQFYAKRKNKRFVTKSIERCRSDPSPFRRLLPHYSWVMQMGDFLTPSFSPSCRTPQSCITRAASPKHNVICNHHTLDPKLLRSHSCRENSLKSWETIQSCTFSVFCVCKSVKTWLLWTTLFKRKSVEGQIYSSGIFLSEKHSGSIW